MPKGADPLRYALTVASFAVFRFVLLFFLGAPLFERYVVGWHASGVRRCQEVLGYGNTYPGRQ